MKSVHQEKKTTATSRAIANNTNSSNKQSSRLQISDNRPQAVQMKQLQEYVNSKASLPFQKSIDSNFSPTSSSLFSSQVIQPVWDEDGPDKFDPEEALKMADFSQAVFVLTHESKNTRSAYAYVSINGWRVCVVAHIHPKNDDKGYAPGNCFIPGWKDWSIRTPEDICKILHSSSDKGSFPGAGRYPQKL